jgi:two-component system, LytTR family, response regulator
MHAIKVVIVDDEFHAGNVLQKMLESDYPHIKILGVVTNIDDAVKVIDEKKPNLVFLDICLRGESGFDLFDKVLRARFETIFTTAHNEFALQAIKFSALDYLLKPIDPADLKTAIGRVSRKFDRKSRSTTVDQFAKIAKVIKSIHSPIAKIAVPSTEGFVMIPVPDIIYCSSNSNYTVFYLTGDRRVTSAYTLRQYEAMLSPLEFFRVHKSFLVNVAHIACYLKTGGGVLMMSNGKKVEISRRNKDRLIDMLTATAKETPES